MRTSCIIKLELWILAYSALSQIQQKRNSRYELFRVLSWAFKTQSTPLKSLIWNTYADHHLLPTQLTCLRTTTVFFYILIKPQIKQVLIFPIQLRILSAQFHSFSCTNLKHTCPSILLQPPTELEPWRNLAAISTAAYTSVKHNRSINFYASYVYFS